MRYQCAVLSFAILFVSIQAINMPEILNSPYLQFRSSRVPAAYAKNPSQYVADMIEKGAILYKRIIQGQVDIQRLQKNTDEYVQSIVALVFYFFSKAVEKKQGFSSGTMVIKDSGFRVYNFLYGYVATKWKPRSMTKETLIDIAGVGAYPRKSTHFNSFYLYTGKAKKGAFRQINKKDDFVHYGIDMPNHFILPAQRKHILFGKVELNPPLIFIKLESHGLGKKGVVQHVGGLSKSQMRKAVGKTIAQLKKIKFTQGNYLEKLLNRFALVSSDDASNARRERIPLSTLTEFLALMLAEGSPLKKEDIDIKGVKGLGIRRMITLLDGYAAGQQGTAAWRMALRDFAQQIRNEYDHVDIRLGREVILTPEVELKG